MKCPKCGYLGFKHVERCPNCGYDFSLSSSHALPDLSLRPNSLNTPQPLADLALLDAGLSLSSPDPRYGMTPDLVSTTGGPAPTPELPLFGSPIVDDTPLITRPSPPRMPLAVRRATPEVPRLRADARTPTLDFLPSDAETRPGPLTPTPAARRTIVRAAPAAEPVVQGDAAASVTARMCAVLIDVVLLAGIDVAVIYFTMQIVGVTFGELPIVPKVPLMAFLAVQNISYFVLFTAGGQTLGQMAFGIKVIADDPAGDSPDLSRAVMRTIIWTALTVPAGLGLTTALLSTDRRGLHDRFSGTRVVRAGA